MAIIKSLIGKINNGDNPLFKELYGTDSATLKEQAVRYTTLMEEYKGKLQQR